MSEQMSTPDAEPIDPTDAESVGTESVDPDDLATPERDSPLIVAIIFVVFAALNGWFLFEAFGTLVSFPSLADELGMADQVSWPVLIAGVALPVVFFVGAGWVGWRHPLTTRVMVLAAGLAATATTSLALYAISSYLFWR